MASHFQPGELVALTEQRGAGSADSAATGDTATVKNDEIDAVTRTGATDASYWHSDAALADIIRQNATKCPSRAVRSSRSRSRPRRHDQGKLLNEVDYLVARRLADQLGWCAMPNGRTLSRLTNGDFVEVPTALFESGNRKGFNDEESGEEESSI